MKTAAITQRLFKENKTPPAGDTPGTKEGYKKAFSGFFTELMPALSAGDGHFTHIAGKFEPAFALRAAEIQVFLAVFESVFGLRHALAEFGCYCKEFLVFSVALFNVARENAEESPDIYCEAQITEQSETGENCDDVNDEACPDLHP